MSWILASVGLLLVLCFARSSRAGFSGPIATLLGLLQIPLAVLSIAVIFVGVGWWCVLPVVMAITLAGLSIDGENIAAWVNIQPITGLLGLASTSAAAAMTWL